MSATTRSAAMDPRRPRHGLGVVGSILFHGAVAAALVNAPTRSDDDLDAVSFTVERHRAPPPPEPEPEPPPPPEPQTVRPRVARAPSREPPAPEPPPETPPPEAPPAPPVFDMSHLATGTDGTWGIATTEGNTLFGPVKRQAVSKNTAPQRAPGVPGGTGTGPATAAPPSITRRPVVDFEATAAYPEQARRERVEGIVVLVVQVLADGRVGTVRIRPGTDPGYGLGRAAVEAMRRFRFSPALDQNRRPVGYTIESYRFRFELPD